MRRFCQKVLPPAEKRPAVSKGRARVLSLVFFYLSRASSSSSSSSSLPLPAVLSSGLPLSASPSSSLLHARRFFAINLEARQKPAVERMLVRERGRERQLSQLVPRASPFFSWIRSLFSVFSFSLSFSERRARALFFITALWILRFVRLKYFASARAGDRGVAHFAPLARGATTHDVHL